MYKGERHFSCLPSLFNGDWCATTHDYGKDKKWGECLGLLKIFVLDLIIFTELTGKKKKGTKDSMTYSLDAKRALLRI